MKIYSMTATFGKLEHATLTLQPGLNIVQAPNEWGKSTWCAFLSAMLYGIETRVHSTKTQLADKERYAPWSGAPMQGRMDLHWNGRDITIERRTKGRAIFGDFKAYETQSGIPVPELTAENCGKLLLGVEKSVFTRTSFIRLNDMPVTQDEALRRRLNELVTTGDESGQSDALAQKLRDLKNKVRLNRSNGLIPQALAQKTDLENKLRQLQQLQTQSQQLKTRQEQVADFAAQLQNHKKALSYAAAQDYAQKAAAARQQLAAAQAKTAQLEEACRQLPTEEALLAHDRQLRQLQSQKDRCQLALAMLPAAPTAPQIPAQFAQPAQVQTDQNAYAQLRKKPLWMLLLLIAGILGFVAGNLLLILKMTLPAIIALLLGSAAGIVSALLLHGRKRKAQTIGSRYHPYAPEDWVHTALEYARSQADYEQALRTYEEDRDALHRQLQDTLAQLENMQHMEQRCQAAMEHHRQLRDAKREQAHLQHLVDTLRSTGSAPEMPTHPDTLHYTQPETNRLLSDAEAEARLLHKQLGQLEGQMQSLGSREALNAELSSVNERLSRLEQTYAALELAQSTLAEAATALQRKFAPAIAKKAQTYFAAITAGRYDRLSLDNELGLHAAADGEDTLTSSLWRSDGTVDQLYLALRLAVADALTPNAPLVLDDALVRFDDTRLAQTMQLLGQTAATKQVILFTCQNRESHHA